MDTLQHNQSGLVPVRLQFFKKQIWTIFAGKSAIINTAIIILNNREFFSKKNRYRFPILPTTYASNAKMFTTSFIQQQGGASPHRKRMKRLNSKCHLELFPMHTHKHTPFITPIIFSKVNLSSIATFLWNVNNHSLTVSIILALLFPVMHAC